LNIKRKEEVLKEYETVQARIAYRWLPDFVDTILEIGCSSGYFSNKLSSRAKNVYGLDINQEHIMIAQKTYPNIKFLAQDAEILPYHEKMFDAVVILEVYEHVKDQKKLINEINRILKPGGVLILSTPNRGLFSFLDSYNLKTRFMRRYPQLVSFLQKKIKRYQSTQYTQNLDWHLHFNLDDLKKTFDGKFVIQKLHRGGLLVFPFFGILRSIIIRTMKNRFLFNLAVNVMNWDGMISFGRMAYNLQVFAIKI